MSITRFLSLVMIVAAAITITAGSASAADIAVWNFNNDDLGNPRDDTAPLAFDNTPAASTDNSVGGSAFAIQLGMTNNYQLAGGANQSEAGSDVLNSAAEGSDFGSGDSGSNLWRVRGQAQQTGDPTGNGWSNQAPEYTQGALFAVDTTGFSNIHFGFDWETTGQGIHDMQVQYTTDGSTWVNVTAAQLSIPNQTPFIDTANNGSVATNLALQQAGIITDPNNGAGVIVGPNPSFNGGWTDHIQVDLSGVAGASNNPNFGIQIVSAFDPTFNNTTPNPSTGQPYSGMTGFDTIYTSFKTGTVAVYNNSSGNWRFDNVTFADAAIPAPEPAGFVLAAIGLFVLGWYGRHRRAALSTAS